MGFAEVYSELGPECTQFEQARLVQYFKCNFKFHEIPEQKP